MRRTRVALLMLVLAVAGLAWARGPARPARRAQPSEATDSLAGKWKPSSPVAFRRAARYLKPIPEATQSYSPMVPALWDLFGMLTDKQIAALGNAQQLTRKLR